MNLLRIGKDIGLLLEVNSTKMGTFTDNYKLFYLLMKLYELVLMPENLISIWTWQKTSFIFKLFYDNDPVVRIAHPSSQTGKISMSKLKCIHFNMFL